MNRLLDALPDETQQGLRNTARIADDIDWPYDVARIDGWRVANEEYQLAQRYFGRREMQSLMEALHIDRPIDASIARDLVIAATDLYLHNHERRMVSRIKDGELRLYSTRCPIYDRLLNPRWHGVTVCGCFARRRGWHDALGIDVREHVLMNKKWGDPVCQLAVHFDEKQVA